MHTLEQYALSCGLKIGKPYIYQKYFSVPFQKYITFNPFTKSNSKKYSYWQEVIDLIFPVLQKNNINIVQLGLTDDPSYNKCLNIKGQTNVNQMSYIINNGLLHFGVDGFPIHVASSFDKKIVGLYSNNYISNSRPYWSNSENVSLIQANLNGKKPSYLIEENPKIIDNIKPEEIAISILNLLDIKETLNHETIFIGQRYHDILIEAIPSVILPNNIFSNIPLNIRLDYVDKIEEQDYISILNNLNIRKCAIITDKAIEVEKLAQLKDKITNIFYDITFNDIDHDFINKTKFFGIKLDFIFNKFKNKDEEALNNKKLELIDCPEIINIVEKQEKPIEEIKKSKFYKSKKILFANNKTYLSKAAFLEDKPTQTLAFQPIDDIQNIDLLIEEDSDFCLFYK
jgi:hypothetical protein